MHSETQTNDGGLARICAASMALVAGLIRLIPHPLNLTPIDALGLFGGARLGSWLAFTLPLAVMSASDVLLWAMYGSKPFNPWVYSCFLLSVVWGRLFLRRSGAGRIAIVGILVGVQFFLVTNFGVWLHSVNDISPLPEGTAVLWKEYPGLPAPVPTAYAHNLSGLIACYVAALPFADTNAPPLGFFGNQLLGDVFYTGLLFGLYAVLRGGVLLPRRLRQPVAARTP